MNSILKKAIAMALCLSLVVVVPPIAEAGIAEYATCAEALRATPGYDYTAKALKQCPALAAVQSDPTLVKTFFVPSNKAIQDTANYIGLSVQTLTGPLFNGVMCNVLKYHIVDGKHLLAGWTKEQTFTTSYSDAQLTIVSTGDPARVKSKSGSTATVELTITCGSSVAYGIDTVLAPFTVPKLG